MLACPKTAVRPLAFLSLAVIRRVLADLILSIPPLAWMFLLTSSSAVCAQVTTLRPETANRISTPQRTGQLLIFMVVFVPANVIRRIYPDNQHRENQ